jgi:RNA polymerase sigma factor (sigma-70 family)
MQGEPSAWEDLVRQFSGMALAVAYERLEDWHLAEDAVQEAFAEAFAHLHQLRKPEAFPGWFKVIVEQRCKRLVRRKRHLTLPIHELEPIPEDKVGVAAIVERREMLQQLQHSIAGLSPKLRLVLQLYYFQGYTLGEISGYLNTPVATLKKRLFDARLKLKKSLPVADFVSVFNDLYPGGEGMLHIVNGDAVASILKQGVVQGDILVWREIYPVGPVFSDMTVSRNRAARALYLEQALGIPQSLFLEGGEQQEALLQDFRKYKDIVLWFEHDLFDQTMLCYLLDWFARQNLGETRLHLLCIGDYPGIELFRGLGQLTPQQMKTLSGTWQAIGQEEFAAGSRMWKAYTSGDIGEHIQFLQENNTSSLPFVQAAFEAHLSRLPSVHHGLGIIEQTTLELLAAGVDRPYDLFNQVGDRLNVLGMGDLEYWYRLGKMSAEPHPLFQVEGASAFPDFSHPVPSFGESRLILTELGRKVLAGEKDWADLQGMDEWFGGLHLKGQPSWRWDAVHRTIT